MYISGETTQKGFYIYDKNRKAKPDPEIYKYIEKARSLSGTSIDPKVLLSLDSRVPIQCSYLELAPVKYKVPKLYLKKCLL